MISNAHLSTEGVSASGRPAPTEALLTSWIGKAFFLHAARGGYSPKSFASRRRRELYRYDSRNRKRIDHPQERNDMTERFRSVTHGTCALDGRHIDPKVAGECPVLRKRSRADQSVSGERPAISLRGVAEGTPSDPEKSITSDTVFRYSRAGKSGRPRVALSEQRRKARERVRAYRDRAHRHECLAGQMPEHVALRRR